MSDYSSVVLVALGDVQRGVADGDAPGEQVFQEQARRALQPAQRRRGVRRFSELGQVGRQPPDGMRMTGALKVGDPFAQTAGIAEVAS